MFARIARKVLEALASPEATTDDRPSNRVRLACEGLEDRCTPAIFGVDSSGDFSDADLTDGKAGKFLEEARIQVWRTSLRSAIEEGNALAAMGKDSDHTIGFDTKAMGTTFVAITKGAYETLKANFTISGGGVTVERPADAATKHRIFDIEANRDVSITKLGIRGGSGPHDDEGGGIRSAGNLAIYESEIYNNYSGGGAGVASLGGNLTIKYSKIWNNTADGIGGGIWTHLDSKNCEISECEIYENEVLGAGLGGGLMLAGVSTIITGTDIYDNTAGGFGGGFYASSSFFITGGEISYNTAGENGGGGFIHTSSDAVSKWYECKVTNNSAGGKGGGFYVEQGKLEFFDPTAFSDNTAGKGLPGGAYLPPNGLATGKGFPVGSQKIEADL